MHNNSIAPAVILYIKDITLTLGDTTLIFAR